MAPIKVKDLAEQEDMYSWVILGDINERLSLRVSPVDFDGLDVVDEDGYLIPGTVLAGDGINLVPVTAAALIARGVVLAPVQIAESNSSDDLNAADLVDVVIVVSGTIEQALAESNLGRAYNANELEALNANQALVLSLTPNS